MRTNKQKQQEKGIRKSYENNIKKVKNDKKNNK